LQYFQSWFNLVYDISKYQNVQFMRK